MQAETKRILIADDDEGIVDATAYMLEVFGYEVSQVYDGNKITGMLINPPDLILLDIWMSGVDGRDVCKQLKADPQTRHIPVLMVSASRDVRDSALASGADDFLEKPFEMDLLLGKVRELAGAV